MAERRAEVFTADYTGEPGQRTFFVQARGDGATLTFLAEKGQVIALAEQMRELLLVVDNADLIAASAPARNPTLSLEAPIEPEWRIGTIALGFIEEDDLVVVALEPVVEEATEVEQLVAETRILIDRDQARAFALHALATVSEGRPLCQLCGLPMDPEGHKCPASNGHRLN
jgi:uncharacterized repeat protein (TIGR03847 family)